ncbi:MAG: sigma-70 family RNA polymerase sigma factor [Clostridia bacterium]|nr:sigma-70 family RNA polymerase sigma factor [Clostridia bacterium]
MKNYLIKEYMENGVLDIERVMYEFTPYIYAIINNKKIILNEEDKEEVISDVFLAVWKNQNKLDLDRKMSLYIGGIVNNIISKKISKISNFLDINEYENNLFTLENFDLKIENKDKTDLILREIENMKQEDKKIFISYYYYSKSLKEISEELNIKEEKIKSRLFRIRKKLKKLLEKRGYSYYE